MKKFFYSFIFACAFVCTSALAAHGATLSLSPSAGSYSVGSVIPINILLDTQGVEIDGVDIHYLRFNPALFQIQDDNPSLAGIQITPGNLMPTTTYNNVNEAQGLIDFSQITAGGSRFKNNNPEILATINARVTALGQHDLTFDAMPGSTTDTNVASLGQEVLTAATGGTFNIGTGTVTPGPTFTMPSGLREGDLIRGPDRIKVYIINQYGFKRHIFNPRVFSFYSHFKWQQIKEVSQAQLNIFKTSDFYRVQGDPKIYSLLEIDEAKGLAQKQWVNVTAQEFAAAGFVDQQIFTINMQEGNYYQEGASLDVQGLRIPSKRRFLAKSATEDTIYYINLRGIKKSIPSSEVFLSYGNRWEDVVTLQPEELNKYPTFHAIKLAGGDGKVYILEQGVKRWISSVSTFVQLGLSWEKVVDVNLVEFNSYLEGASL